MYPKSITAIKVDQVFGEFYICKINARDLLALSFTDPLRYVDKSGTLSGNQRTIKTERIDEIGKFIQTVDACFPNSIIISANYDDNGFLCEDENKRWHVRENADCNTFELIIPSEDKLASIIDGQHRLYGFLKAPDQFQDFELLCSVYLDLPNPYQAYIFATINFNQKKVDKSLAYEQFGFNIDDEPVISWSPEKLAVFLTRKLNTDSEKESTFYNHIILAPQEDDILFQKRAKDTEWAISTSTIVDCILRLISTNPKKDKYELHKYLLTERKRDVLKLDGTPFRQFYLENNDLVIYTAIYNFFKAAETLLFEKATQKSYIRKTIGVQGLFDFLKFISEKKLQDTKDISVGFYTNYLTPAAGVDFSDNYYQASGVGRSRIKNTFLLANSLVAEDKLKETDVVEIKRLLKR